MYHNEQKVSDNVIIIPNIHKDHAEYSLTPHQEWIKEENLKVVIGKRNNCDRDVDPRKQQAYEASVRTRAWRYFQDVYRYIMD